MRLSPWLCLAVSLAVAGDTSAADPRKSDARDRGPTILLQRDAGTADRIEIRGLSAEQVQRLGTLKGAAEWSEVFAVHVGTEPDQAKQPLLGDFSLADGVARFAPRFPLAPGLTYTAVFRPGRLTAPDRKADAVVTHEFRIPAAPRSEPAVVRRVYPTRDVLPENLLKFYLHFSAPMSRGDAYSHLHLLTADGTEVELPFLELGEELWNDAGTRLTVFFDPGRIKRGLKPREEFGPILEEGKSYALVIDADWPDADGRPLKTGFRKTFQAGPPDDQQPAPQRWTIRSPTADTRAPLVVAFDEPLDHALLRRVLTVRHSDGEPVRGAVEIDRGETRWRFRPQRPWRKGDYELVARTTLEDLAGNSIGRPFEVDVFRPIERRTIEATTSLPFTVR